MLQSWFQGTSFNLHFETVPKNHSHPSLAIRQISGYEILLDQRKNQNKVSLCYFVTMQTFSLYKW